MRGRLQPSPRFIVSHASLAVRDDATRRRSVHHAERRKVGGSRTASRKCRHLRTTSPSPTCVMARERWARSRHGDVTPLRRPRGAGTRPRGSPPARAPNRVGSTRGRSRRAAASIFRARSSRSRGRPPSTRSNRARESDRRSRTLDPRWAQAIHEAPRTLRQATRSRSWRRARTSGARLLHRARLLRARRRFVLPPACESATFRSRSPDLRHAQP
jgi:hypothetical protein